ncbi:uncharacterized [Tachysurus ichikawai]
MKSLKYCRFMKVSSYVSCRMCHAGKTSLSNQSSAAITKGTQNPGGGDEETAFSTSGLTANGPVFFN